MPDVTRAVLATHTTLRLGGPAGQLAVATTEDEVVHMVRAAGPAHVLLLAGGSNVVIADDGVPGLVVLLRAEGVTAEPGPAGEVLVRASAGHPWDDLVAQTVAAGWSGLECLSGIPGSVGATPIQNVGAYGQEVADTITAVRVYDRHDDAVRDLEPGQCGFAYRTSVFKHNPRYVVLAVTFRLRAGASGEPIGYAELARALGVEIGQRAPLAQVRAAVLRLRAGKGMVLDPADPDTYSVGSFFTNPVLDPDAFAVLCGRAEAEPVAWPAPGGRKVSAAWLIERAGFGRGYSGGHPGVAVSSKHTLALTNRGTGTTTALLALAREIRDGVRKSFEVELQPEPVLVNCAL